MTATWSIVATVCEDLKVIQTFVAHHLILGADAITLYFDDPNDPAFEQVAALGRVTAIKCDDAHWNGNRPAAHQARQKYNANHAYAAAKTDWIIHIDADELITSTVPVTKALAQHATETQTLRLIPAEALENRRDPDLGIFRMPLPANRRGNRIGHEAYGAEYPLLNQGLLSHVAGKFFVRTGIKEMSLSIHGPRLGDTRQDGTPQDDMVLLHLHGDNEDHWLSKVHTRMERGVYRAAFHDDRRRAAQLDGRGFNAHLQHIYDADGTDGLRAFFRRVSTFDRAKRKLRRPGLLIKQRLWRAEKIATVFGGPAQVQNLGVCPETGELEGDIMLGAVAMRIGLDNNYTEIRLGQGSPDEAAEMAAICEIVRDKAVDFYDIGANVGLYSLIVAHAALPESTITAFEPNPRMADKLIRNRDLNNGMKIDLIRAALGDKTGDIQLSAPANPGQATILQDAQNANSFTVAMRQLKDVVRPKNRLSLFKIDIEGAEPLCLAPFFKDAAPDFWPDYILYEHAHTDVWPLPPEQVFPDGAYDVAHIFATNTLLKRKSRAT